LAVAVHQACGSGAMFVIQMKDPKREDVWKALEHVGDTHGYTKFVIAVDEDINPWEADTVNWAISFRQQPDRDIKIVTKKLSAQDHSAFPCDHPIRDPSLTEPAQGTRLLIDATKKWPYPPVSLPKKEFMERAIEIWNELNMPTLKLKDPWWGYNLGFWSDELAEEADMAVKGEYYKTGEKLATRRKPSK